MEKVDLATDVLAKLTELEGELRKENSLEADKDNGEVRYFMTALRIMRDSWIEAGAQRHVDEEEEQE